jgi:hypothetical protein
MTRIPCDTDDASTQHVRDFIFPSVIKPQLSFRRTSQSEEWASCLNESELKEGCGANDTGGWTATCLKRKLEYICKLYQQSFTSTSSVPN